MQKAAVLNTCHTVGNFLSELRIRSASSVRLVLFENRLNCCDVRVVADDDDGDDDDDSNKTTLIVQSLKSAA
jgi:hypothetical protein